MPILVQMGSFLWQLRQVNILNPFMFLLPSSLPFAWMRTATSSNSTLIEHYPNRKLPSSSLDLLWSSHLFELYSRRSVMNLNIQFLVNTNMTVRNTLWHYYCQGISGQVSPSQTRASWVWRQHSTQKQLRSILLKLQLLTGILRIHSLVQRKYLSRLLVSWSKKWWN